MGKNNTQKFAIKTQHKKLYKSGKNWLIGGATFLTFAGVYQFLTPQVHADITDNSNANSSNLTNSNTSLATSSATSIVTSSSGSLVSSINANNSSANSNTSDVNSTSTSTSNSVLSSFSNNSSSNNLSSTLTSDTTNKASASIDNKSATSSVSSATTTVSSNLSSNSSLSANSSSVSSSQTINSSSTSSDSSEHSSSNTLQNSSNASSNAITSSVASSGTNSVASTTNSLQLFTSKDGQSVLNTDALTTFLDSNSTVKSNVIKQFNLQAVADDDLSSELEDRIGTDATQGQILMSLVNYNPQTSFVLGNTISMNANNNTISIYGSVTAGTNGTSSSYPQYYVFSPSYPYLVLLPDDSSGNSQINGISSVTIDTKALGVTNSTTTQITNTSAQNVMPGVNVYYHLTKDQAYSLYAQNANGTALPLNSADDYWTNSALAGGTRTYTMVLANQSPDQMNSSGNNPDRLLVGGDYINYSMNFINNNNFNGGSGYRVAHYFNYKLLPTVKVNYQDMNGNSIGSSQYLDSATTPLSPGASYSATVPTSNGYVPYQTSLESNYNAQGSATINNDNSVSINGTVSAVWALSYVNNNTVSQVNNTYDLTYVKPTVQTNTKTVNRTVNFVDTNGNQLASSNNQSVTMTQNAVYDSLTNKFLGYLPAGQSSFTNLSSLSQNNDSSTWNYTNGTQFNGVSAVDLSSQGYQPIDIASINSENVNNNSNNETYNIVYNKVPAKTGAFVGTVNRNVSLVDANTGNVINYSGTINSSTYNNGNFTSSNTQTSDIKPIYGQPTTSSDTNVVKVNQYITGYTGVSYTVSMGTTDVPDLSSLGYGSPSMTQVSSTTNTFDDSETVNQNYLIKYGHATTTVDKNNTHNPGDNIPGTNAQYPSGVTLSDLQKTVSRQINYLDDENHNTVVADPVTESQIFNRVAIVDKVTGALLGYAKPNTTTVVANDDAWDNENAQFPEVPSANLSQLGYSAPSIQTVSQADVKATDDNSVVNVYYPHAYQVVHADETKSTNDLIEGTNNHFASNITADMLNTTTSWTIHYVDKDTGKTVASDYAPKLTFTKAAVVDKVTGQLMGYVKNDTTTSDGSTDDPWNNTTGTFADATSPDLKSAGYINADPSVSKGFVIKPGADNIVNTVTYQRAYSVVYPDGSKNPGDQITGYDTKYGSGATYNDLNKTITRRIHYLDYNDGYINPNLEISPTVVETVTFKRAAVIDNSTGAVVGYSTLANPKVTVTNPNDAWTTDKNNYDSVVSPDLTNQGYSSPNQSQINAQTVSPTDNGVDIDVLYTHAKAFIPANSPQNQGATISGTNSKYPSGVTQSDLNRQITRTIQYQDSQTNNSIANTVIQPVNYYRNALVDKVTGQLLGYADNSGNLLADQSKWLTDKNTFDAVDSPDLSKSGYTKPDIGTVNTQSVGQDDTNQSVVVKYNHGVSFVKSTNPQNSGVGITGINQTYPSGVSQNDLNRQITRTIQYQDSQTNNSVAPTVVQSVSYYRNALVDDVSGKLLGYADNDGNLLADQSKWLTDNNTFDAVNSPDLTVNGYTKPDVSVINSQTVGQSDSNLVDTVKYMHAIAFVRHDNPEINGSLISGTNQTYPSGINQSDLNRQINRTIQYQDAQNNNNVAPTVSQSVSYYRNALVDKVSGKLLGYADDNGVLLTDQSKWLTTNNVFAAVNSPDLTNSGYTAPDIKTVNSQTVGQDDTNQAVTVKYNHAVEFINHNYPEDNGDPIFGTTQSYPSGISRNDLNHQINRKIQYRDVKNNELVAPDVFQDVSYYRNALVDKVTGKLLGYADATGKLLDDQNSWLTDKNTFNAVDSPDLTSKGYTTPDIKTVGSQSVKQVDSDQLATVKYDHTTEVVTSDNPKQMTDKIDSSDANYPRDIDKNALNKQVSRTIEYQNQRGDSISNSVVQTVNFTRKALVDKVSGQLLGYLDKNGHVVTNGGDAWTSDKASFDSLNSPDLSNLGYDNPNPSSVTNTPVDVNQDNQTVVVTYADKLITIPANDGKTPSDMIATTTNRYPSGVASNDLNKKITRTIQYVDDTGTALQTPTVQTAHFTRNAIVDEATGRLVKYTDWQSVDNQVSALPIPTINDYQVENSPSIDKTVLTLDNGNVVQVIRYKKNVMQVPTHNYQIVYGNRGDLTNLPAGLVASDLHRVVKRTINYLNDSGQQMANSVIQTMNFYRNAIVDLDTNQVIGYTNTDSQTPFSDAKAAWYSVDTRFSAVGSPDFTDDGYQQANPVIVPAIDALFNAADSTVNVLYHKTVVTSQAVPSQHELPSSTSSESKSKPSHHKSHGQPVEFFDGPYATMPKASDAKVSKPDTKYAESVVWRSKASDKAVVVANVNQKQQSIANNQSTKTLPQTGHSDADGILELIGLLALLSSGLYVGLSTKKKFER